MESYLNITTVYREPSILLEERMIDTGALTDLKKHIDEKGVLCKLHNLELEKYNRYNEELKNKISEISTKAASIKLDVGFLDKAIINDTQTSKTYCQRLESEECSYESIVSANELLSMRIIDNSKNVETALAIFEEDNNKLNKQRDEYSLKHKEIESMKESTSVYLNNNYIFLKAIRDVLKQEGNDLQSSIDGINNKIKSLKAKKTKLTNSLDEVTNQISISQDVICGYDNEIKELEEKLNRADTIYSAAKTSVMGSLADVERLKKKIKIRKVVVEVLSLLALCLVIDLCWSIFV